jgi:hypothetical protein
MCINQVVKICSVLVSRNMKVGILFSDSLLNVAIHVLYVCKYVSLVNLSPQLISLLVVKYENVIV